MPTTDSERTSLKLVLPIREAAYLARAGLGAVSKDDDTPSLTGVLLAATAGIAKVVSTDRYRVNRAECAAEGDVAPVLVPWRLMRWLADNEHFFRGQSSAVTFEFDITARGEAGADTMIACQGGRVTVRIAEDDLPNADEITCTMELLHTPYPTVERLIDTALAEQSGPAQGHLNMRMLADAAALAFERDETAEVRFLPPRGDRPAGRALFSYSHGVTLIQMAVAE